jgi:hypothetical protein
MPCSELVGVGDHEIERGVEAAQAIEIHAGELDRRHLARLEQLREVRQRPERDVFQVGRTAQRRRRARSKRLRRAIEARARHDRAEVQRRRDVRVDVDLPQLRVAGQVLVDAGEDLLPLLLGELEAGDRQRLFQHGGGDARGLLVLQPGPQHAGQQGRRQADGREVADESSSACHGLRHTAPMLSEQGQISIFEI